MTPATTDELRAAYNRATGLRFLGFSFERALATPIVRMGLECSAAARRHTESAQPELPLEPQS